MNTIRAKFYVSSAKKDEYGNENVNLNAVIGNGSASDENKSFSNATPNGQVAMSISNPEAQGFFVEGSEYYLDFSAASDPVDGNSVAESKHIRQRLDAVLQELKSFKGSRERALSITKLQESIMWLGMDLKAINESNPGSAENPYPHSYDPKSPIIDKTADNLKL